MKQNSERYLAQMGAQIRAARLRRNLTVEQVARRAGMSAVTVLNIEKGLPSVSLGKLVGVLEVLGLEESVALVARDDEQGRAMQDEVLRKRARPVKKNKVVVKVHK